MSSIGHIQLPDTPSIYIATGIDQDPAAKGPQQIAAIWGRAKQASEREDEGQWIDCLNELGVSKTDTVAHGALIPILQKVFSNQVIIEPAQGADDSGVYFLSIQGEERPFAVFKIGEKRARMELLVRHIAHRLGLGKHAIAGLFCSIAHPTFSKGDTCVELWNGRQKVFEGEIGSDSEDYSDDEWVGKDTKESEILPESNSPFPPTITGILEPFLPAANGPVSIEDFAKMTVLALAVGLRDAKTDGIVGATFIDTEEAMPGRLDPATNPLKKVAATHLPYLESPLATEILSMDLIENLHQIVRADFWNVYTMLKDLEMQTVLFADRELERPSIIPEKIYLDQGNQYVRIEPISKVMDDQSDDFDPNVRAEILSPDQLDATAKRMTRIGDTISAFRAGNIPNPTVSALVSQVDPHYAAHKKALEKALIGNDQNVGNMVRTQPLSAILGRMSPHACQIQFFPERAEKKE